MKTDLLSQVIIYSPVMAMMGYPLVYTVIGGTYISIVLSAATALGGFLFLNFLRKKSQFWWTGMIYPVLLIIILLTEIVSLGTPVSFMVAGEGLTPARFRAMLYYLIIPVSLLFFAAMTPEFRKMMKIPLLIAAFISILMLLPMYETLSYAFFPPEGGMITDVTYGFIILILVGFCGIPPLVVFGLLNSLQISRSIRTEPADEGDVHE